MYIFYPLGGLANRMRTIDSIKNFEQVYNENCQIIWIKDNGLNCNFNTIWEATPNLKDSDSQFFEQFFKLRRRSKLFRLFLLLLQKLNFLRVISEDEYEELFNLVKHKEKVQKYKYNIIASFSAFMPSEEFRTHIFQLRSDLKKIIELETSNFDEHTIGIHIRRTDNVDSINNSPLELFEKAISNEIEKDLKSNFYLASDDEEVKQAFRDKYGDAILLPNGVLTRSSKEGIIQAVKEMYALSQTKKILGSYYSSFSGMAAIIGKLEIQTVKNV